MGSYTLSSGDVTKVVEYIHNKLIDCGEKRVIAKTVFGALKDGFETELDEVKFRVDLKKIIDSDPLLISKRGKYGGIYLVDNDKKDNVPPEKNSKDEKVAANRDSKTKKSQELPKKEADEKNNDGDGESKIKNILSEYLKKEKEDRPEAKDLLKRGFSRGENLSLDSEKQDVYIRDKHYTVVINEANLDSIIRRVVDAEEDESGFIKCLDKTYTCTDRDAVILQRIIHFVLGGATVIASGSEEYEDPRPWIHAEE
jgi:hypothetical protein